MPIVDLDNAWDAKQLYHRPTNKLILWYFYRETACSKIAIRSLPSFEYHTIGDYGGDALENTDHGPSYDFPFTNDGCRYLYTFRARAVPEGQKGNDDYDLVRFDLHQPVTSTSQEIIIEDLWHLFSLCAWDIIGAKGDDTLICTGRFEGHIQGNYLFELDLHTCQYKILYPLQEHTFVGR